MLIIAAAIMVIMVLVLMHCIPIYINLRHSEACFKLLTDMVRMQNLKTSVKNGDAAKLNPQDHVLKSERDQALQDLRTIQEVIMSPTDAFRLLQHFLINLLHSQKRIPTHAAKQAIFNLDE